MTRGEGLTILFCETELWKTNCCFGSSSLGKILFRLCTVGSVFPQGRVQKNPRSRPFVRITFRGHLMSL